MKGYATLALAVFVVLLLAEISPEAVNVVLALILLGMVLMRAEEMQDMIETISSVAD